MPTCFVIQPFDGGPFDKRYKDTVAPAIEAAGLEPYRVDRDLGLEPYRVDRDLGAAILIDQIEEGIRTAQACVADISTNNPNVWFELGYAIASGKPVVLLALDEPNRKFPFDVQHRPVVRYRTDSASDFEHLRDQITSRLKAILAKEEKLERVVQPTSIADIEGLSQHELVALVAIAENIDTPVSGVSTYTVRNDMERAGFTRVAVTLALGQLARKGFVTHQEEREWNDSYTAYSLTEQGINWLYQHQELLVLRRDPPEPPVQASPSGGDDEDVPF